jgi:hypothetical protein
VPVLPSDDSGVPHWAEAKWSDKFRSGGGEPPAFPDPVVLVMCYAGWREEIANSGRASTSRRWFEPTCPATCSSHTPHGLWPPSPRPNPDRPSQPHGLASGEDGLAVPHRLKQGIHPWAYRTTTCCGIKIRTYPILRILRDMGFTTMQDGLQTPVTASAESALDGGSPVSCGP